MKVKAEMVLGRLVQKDGHLATDMDGNPRQVRLLFNSLLSSSPLARSSVTRYTTYVLIIPVKILVFFIAMVGIEEYKTDVEMRWTLDIKMNWPPRLFFRGTPTSYLTPPA